VPVAVEELKTNGEAVVAVLVPKVNNDFLVVVVSSVVAPVLAVEDVLKENVDLSVAFVALGVLKTNGDAVVLVEPKADVVFSVVSFTIPSLVAVDVGVKENACLDVVSVALGGTKPNGDAVDFSAVLPKVDAVFSVVSFTVSSVVVVDVGVKENAGLDVVSVGLELVKPENPPKGLGVATPEVLTGAVDTAPKPNAGVVAGVEAFSLSAVAVVDVVLNVNAGLDVDSVD
jgi:hypothetical protein